MLLRRGRRRIWIADALSPLRVNMKQDHFDRLVLAIASATGIEAFVWLRDIAGLSNAEALDIMRFSAESLLDNVDRSDGASRRTRRV